MKQFFSLEKYNYFSSSTKACGGHFCDLIKAFACVNHDILLNKLHYCGIRRTSLSWFQSYLEKRKQKVCLRPDMHDLQASSEWEEIDIGVLQGSILGLLTFIIYVNDLPYGMHLGNKRVMYTDDTSVLLKADNDAELKSKINYVLEYMAEWFSANGIFIEYGKTNIMKFTPSNSQNEIFQIIHKNGLLIGISNTKYLGIELNKNINWKNHIQ